MTITTHDCFAVLPKRCDKCNRLFWLEPYDIYYKEVGIEHYSLKQIKCGKHYEGRGMRVVEKIGQLQAGIKELEEKYCECCQKYSCGDCPIDIEGQNDK